MDALRPIGLPAVASSSHHSNELEVRVAKCQDPGVSCRALFVIIGLLARDATADPRPIHLTMKQTDGTNLHVANHGGAIHWQTDITIAVDLLADHTLAAVSDGSRSEHDLWPGPSSRSTEDGTVWTTRWSGTWAETGHKLALELTLVDDRCTRTKGMREFDASRGLWVDYTPESVPCIATPRQAHLACTSEQVKLEDPDHPLGAPEVAAWRCEPSTPSDLGESPRQWLLGKTVCIQTSAAHTGAPGGPQTCRP